MNHRMDGNAIIERQVPALAVTSEAFGDQEMIPPQFTCDGANINPPLAIGGIPPETKSLVFIVDDPDAPIGTWVHWLQWNIPATGSYPARTEMGIRGKNDFGKNSYGGPCPPPGQTHRYRFQVFALGRELSLQAGSGRDKLEKAMRDAVIASGYLTGIYKRK